MNLEKPLVFFDLETTGTNVNTDRIVEISVIKMTTDGEKNIYTKLVNPEMLIPDGAAEVHGIRDEDVKDAPTFREIAPKLVEYLKDCDLGGYNIIKFDVPLLKAEFNRVNIKFSMEGRRLLDSYRIFLNNEPRTLAGALKFYCGKEIENAHSAEADTKATLDVFEAQLEKYSLGDFDEIHESCDKKDPNWIDGGGRFRWINGEAAVGFGKNSGAPLKEIAINNPGFLRWIIKMDFEDDVKDIAQNALQGMFPDIKDK